MYLVNDVLTMFDIVCKNTDKTCVEFGLDLGYHFLAPHMVMDLTLKISKKLDLFTDVDQHLFVEKSLREGRFSTKSNPGNQSDWTLVKPGMQFSGYEHPLSITNISSLFSVWELQRLENPLLRISLTFPLLRKMDHKHGFLKLVVKYQLNFMTW